YVVERSTTGALYTTIKQGTYPAIHPVLETGLFADTPYFYRIKAKNGDGDVAAASVVVTTRTLAVPAPVIIGISPTSAKNLGISTFSLTGNNFLTGAV